MARKKGSKNKTVKTATSSKTIKVAPTFSHEETGDEVFMSPPLLVKDLVISSLSLDTGREETNTIVAKINEIITWINDH